jgi:hypothetical protein
LLGRLSNETHATAQRKQEQMEKLRQAFGLKDVSMDCWQRLRTINASFTPVVML